jgi:exodeoxyribonuclease V alpha subunit
LLRQYEARTGIALAPRQTEAVRRALVESMLVITGGPGVGKTTIVRAIVAAYLENNLRVALAAPTGRAAKRLQEATGQPAATLHRLLEWRPAETALAATPSDRFRPTCWWSTRRRCSTSACAPTW